ncbi:MAG TPA: hypothetical protein VFY71_10665 [Planctomycetota bacterium]|nr:hypothetical protein [Planctomycetota bacterium]
MSAGEAFPTAHPAGAAGPGHRVLRARRVALLGLLAALCGWRLVDSLVVQAGVVAEIGLARRVELLTLDVAERTRRTLGENAGLLDALRAHVPARARVALSLRRQDLPRSELLQLLLLRDQLAVLLYPLDVLAIPGPMPDVTGVQGLINPETWVADLAPDVPFQQQQQFDLVLDAGTFRLWRLRGATR